MKPREMWLVDSGQDEWEREVTAAFKTKALAETVAELLNERAFCVPYYDTIPPYYEWLTLTTEIDEDGVVSPTEEDTTSRFLGSPRPHLGPPIVSVERHENRLHILVRVWGWDHDHVRGVFAAKLAEAVENHRALFDEFILKKAAEFYEQPRPYADWFDVDMVERARVLEARHAMDKP